MDPLLSLHEAILRSELDFIESEIEEGANLEAHCYGWAPLHSAMLASDPRVVQLLIDHGANISARFIDGPTPLHMVYSCDDRLNDGFDFYKLLLENGADPNDRNAEGVTPLLNALKESNSVENVKLLLIHYGADMTAVDKYSQTALCYAAMNPRKAIAKFVIQKIVEIEVSNLCICQDDRQLIENDGTYKQYYEEHYEACSHEVRGMKEAKFYNSVSVFSVLMGTKKEIRGCARNEELVKALEAKDYENEFPIYFVLMNKRFRAEVKKQRLRNITGQILCNVFKFNDYLHPVNHRILSYLSDEDLVCLNAEFK